jgi:hypothetical protein
VNVVAAPPENPVVFEVCTLPFIAKSSLVVLVEIRFVPAFIVDPRSNVNIVPVMPEIAHAVFSTNVVLFDI